MVVWFPLWLELDIVIGVLMSVEEISVTELGSDQAGFQLEVSNLDLLTSDLWWCGPSINFVDGGTRLDFLELVNIIHMILWLSVRDHAREA